MYSQKARRTRSEKVSAHHTISWSLGKDSEPVSKFKAKKSNIKTSNGSSDINISHDIAKSLIIASIIISLQVVMYFYFR